MRLARVIVRRQEDFFRSGPSRLKAMGMEEVAEEMGVHVSTVSRACRDKYLLCKWGMKELRSFRLKAAFPRRVRPPEPWLPEPSRS